MRTVDSAYLKMLARMAYKASYEFRLIDQDDKAYPIPSRAVLSAPPSAAVDTGTWEMPVSIMASQMPAGVSPQQYHRIEVDRVVAGNRMPYFRGLIDEVTQGWAKENGTVVETMNLACFGVLQKAKGYRVDSLRIDPTTQDGPFQINGLSRQTTWAPGTTVTAPASETIPYYGSWESGSLVRIFTDATMTTQYAMGTDFTITDGIPRIVNWLNTPSSTRVIRHAMLERFVRLEQPTSDGIVEMPIGRDYDSLFHTSILEIDGSWIRLADPTGYRSPLYLLHDDFVVITTAAGASHVISRQYNQANSGGWLQLNAAIPADVAVGDSVRNPTTESTSAWDDDRLWMFWQSSSGYAGTEWNRRLFTPHPTLGVAVPTPRIWFPSEEVWADSVFPDGVGYIREDVDANRIEEAVKTILTTTTGLFDAADVTTEPSGVYVKNRTWSGVDLSDVLTEFKDQAFSPSTFIHDTRDGKITIKPYRQKLDPDWVLRGIQRIEETEIPEPITAVTIIAEAQEPVNLAGEWLYAVEDAVNPDRLTDTNKDAGVATTATVPADGFGVKFRIPTPSPETIHPTISAIRITGTGLVSAYFAEDPDNGPFYVLPGMNFTPIKNGTLEIGGDTISRVITAAAGFLVISFQAVTSGDTEPGSVITPPTCSEIEILAKKTGYWRAALTDDTALAPANNGVDEFGTIWRQPDATKRESYRFAPTAYLKRVQPLYPTKARDHVLSMSGISQQDTRDYSERWQDEFLRAGKSYTVTAPYDDRAELGDTVAVAWQGFRKDLFLWGIQGPSNPREVLATYQFIDYSL